MLWHAHYNFDCNIYIHIYKSSVLDIYVKYTFDYFAIDFEA